MKTCRHLGDYQNQKAFIIIVTQVTCDNEIPVHSSCLNNINK